MNNFKIGDEITTTKNVNIQGVITGFTDDYIIVNDSELQSAVYLQDEPRKISSDDNTTIIKLKLNYDDSGRSYVLYKGVRVYIFMAQHDYGILKELNVICEPIDTYIVFEELRSEENGN